MLWLASALITVSLMAADLDLPPPRYDHPYRGPVDYVYDYPQEYNGDWFWGYTELPKFRGGRCVVHLSPIGSVLDDQVMTPAALRRLIRHETGHCNGWRHHD